MNSVRASRRTGHQNGGGVFNPARQCLREGWGGEVLTLILYRDGAPQQQYATRVRIRSLEDKSFTPLAALQPYQAPAEDCLVGE